MGAAPEPLVGELGEPALDEVDPRAVGRREVQVKPGVAHEPAVDLGGLVRRDVVDDEVDVEIVGHAAVDEVQEAAELDGPVALGHVGDHVPEATSRAA